MTIEVYDYLEIARSRYTDLFKNDQVFDLLIQTIVSLHQEKQLEYINYHDNVFNIDNQIGQGLDLIGEIVGQPRILVDFNKNKYFGFEGSFNSGTFGTISDSDIGSPWFSILNPSENSIRRMNDDEYKRVIKARIIKNNSNNSVNDFLEVLNILTGNASNFIESHEHGDIVLNLSQDNIGLITYFCSRWTLKDNIFPIQAGYRLIVNNSLPELP